MTPDARAMYEQVILDHNKHPRNYGSLGDADQVIDGYNPLCGDAFKVYLKFSGDSIEKACFEGSGCAISKSSASIMTSLVIGKTREQARALFSAFQDMLVSEAWDGEKADKLGLLNAFSGVRDYPMRIKCATLAWHALCAGLESRLEDHKDISVSTE